MNEIFNFIKEIFMITPQESYVGLSAIKPKKIVKKHISKSVKASEQRLSDLMRKERKAVKQKTF